MRVLVCGDRRMTDMALVRATLSEHSIDVLIEGEARGADALAKIWAKEHGISIVKFPADWLRYGKAAGPIRNRQMLMDGKPDLVVAFLAKGSRGTANMVSQARQAGVPVRVVNV